MLRAAELAAIRGDRKLFSGLSFTLETGELLHVDGPNGSGKTTLLRILCGLGTPSEGTVYWCGAPIRALGDAYRAELVYLGHHSGVKDELNALENLRISSRLAGQEVSEAEALAALAHIGLLGLEDLPARVLSQGQKRRVALARLLLTRARLWILDEPFTALDAAAIGLLRTAVVDHLGRGGLVVLTTHQRVELNAVTVRRIEMGR